MAPLRAFLILALSTTLLLGASQEAMQAAQSNRAVLSVLSESVNGVPRWVLSGILYRESRSRYRANGSIIYVDRRRGASHEIGPFQLTPIVRDQVEQFYKMPFKPDSAFKSTWLCELYATLYLKWLYKHCADQSWDMTIRMYNAGPTGPIYASSVSAYLYDVKAFK
jgi:hypothetical protein